MGIDFGESRTGLAISDELGLIAQGLTTFQGAEDEDFLINLSNIVKEKKVERIVVGLPKMMNGSLGEKAQKVKKFAEDIERKLGITTVLWDERLSSVQSQKILRQMGKKPSREKGMIDQIAAVLILQSYLDYDNTREKSE